MSNKQPLENAGKIIERFGGIRPMAAKTDTPVTTVQGWKKRDVIPANRRAQVMKAAEQNNIDISDLTASSVGEVVSTKAKTPIKSVQPTEANKSFHQQKATSVPSSRISSNDEYSFEEKQLRVAKIKDSTTAEIEEVKQRNKKSATHERSLKEIDQNNRKAVAVSAWVATGLILLAAGVGAFFMWPKLQNQKKIIQNQSQQLVHLENQVQEVQQDQSETKKKFLGTSIPDNMQEKIDSLQNQARNISVTVDQLSERAKAISQEAMGGTSLAISQRLEILENKIEELSGPEGSFAAIVARIRELEDTVTGQVQLEQSADQLRFMMNNSGEVITESLEGAQEQASGALGQTLEGVPGNDLKAAAILIAFSQFRNSLDRQQPIDQDLELLKKLVGEDNPELQDNLQRLSAYADEGGVLTPSGLSSELKQLTGDIVVSSLNGEDVSFAEKAKARFGNIVQIEKDGELVTGTKTQVTINKAQEYIDQGKIEDSIVTLEGLDGDAAIAAQPFIQKAKGSLLAEKVKTMMNEIILSKVDAQNGINVPNIDMNSIKQKLDGAIPFMGDGIIKDEESGVTILPPQSGFKGLSGQ